MHRKILGVLVTSAALCPAAHAQAPRAATYITDEEVKTVNREPGIDRTIKVVDIGSENLAVGIIHRGASRAAATTPGTAAPAGRASAPPAEPCGETSTGALASGLPSGITHDSQTEGYVIVSGGGTLVTGGHIVNGRRSGAGWAGDAHQRDDGARLLQGDESDRQVGESRHREVHDRRRDHGRAGP